MKTNPAKGNVGKFMTMDWKILRKTLNILGSENCSDCTRIPVKILQKTECPTLRMKGKLIVLKIVMI